jgi:mRNA-degrading endonuclease RelE of RelBE toxin-antitoxin system
MRLILSRGAQNGLYGMSRRDRQRMLAKLEAFAAEPFASHAWATRLQGEDRVRIRQGDWRGVLLIVREQDAVVLERVAHRREVYR